MNDGSAIIDTNVVASGLVTANPTSPTACILNAMLAGDGIFLLSLALLAEYRRVLLRPRIQKRHGLAGTEIDQILSTIVMNAALREAAPPLIPAPDPGDDHLWALLAVAPHAVLVTGDRLLLEKPFPGRSVLTARAFQDLREAECFGRPGHRLRRD